MTSLKIGPVLRSVLGAQEIETAAVAFPQISSNASLLMDMSCHLGSSLIWPVGPAAERIAGAAALLAGGEMRLRTWSQDVQGEAVLIFAVVARTPLALQGAARQAFCMGAKSVEACVLELDVFEIQDTLPIVKMGNTPRVLALTGSRSS
jgi:hypothetical protein